MTAEAFEALTRRVAALEEQVRALSAPKDWRRVAGMFADSASAREVEAEIAAARERDRQEFFEQYDREAREAAARTEVPE